MFLKKLKTLLPILVCMLMLITTQAFASGDYTITIRSTYQTSEGGNPEFTVTDINGNSKKVVVSDKDGTTIHVPKGTYKIRETKTTEGFTPQSKKDVEITLPHEDEKGNYHTSVVIEMKSEKYSPSTEPNVPNEEEKGTPEKIKDSGKPLVLKERDKKEEPKEEPEEDIGEDVEQIPDTSEPVQDPNQSPNPKTGDTTFYLEMVGLLVLVALAGCLVYINKNHKKDARWFYERSKSINSVVILCNFAR